MTQSNNNMSVLPFYRSLQMQNHRRSFSYGRIYPLLAPSNYLLPFQIYEPNLDAALNVISVTDLRAWLYDRKGNVVKDFTQSLIDGGLAVKAFERDYSIVFPARGAFNRLDEGQYYIELKDTKNGVDYYSEIFVAVHDLSGCLRIEWFNVEDHDTGIGKIVYQDPAFSWRLYLHAELGKPEYKTEEEGTTRDGYFFPTKQVSYKVYKAFFPAPEYLLDVMRLIWCADVVKITDSYGQVFYSDTFDVHESWDDQGDVSKTRIEFTTDTVIKKNGRAVIDTSALRGDYNQDYDDDMTNQQG